MVDITSFSFGFSCLLSINNCRERYWFSLLVAQKETTGAVYSLNAFNGKLLASINSKDPFVLSDAPG